MVIFGSQEGSASKRDFKNAALYYKLHSVAWVIKDVLSSEIVSGEACPYSARYSHIGSNFLHNVRRITIPCDRLDPEKLNVATSTALPNQSSQ